MTGALFRNKRFLAGFIFVFGLFVLSFVYELFKSHLQLRVGLLYDANGQLIGKSPFPPSLVPPLGTDRRGYKMLYIGIAGAKYTIGFALAVALLRMALATGIGVLKAQYTKPLPSRPSNILGSFQYLPMALLCYVILKPVVFLNPQFDVMQTTIFEAIIIMLVAIPTLSVLIGNEVDTILQKEFIIGVRTLGASKFHILRKHVRPHIWPRLMIIFVEQVIQVLLILLHLGLFTLFLGGTLRERTMSANKWIYYSSTGDWASTFGHHYAEINIFPWIPYSMILFFAVTIVFLNLMLEGMKDVFSRGYGEIVVRKRKHRTPKHQAEKAPVLGDDAFQAVQSKDISV